MLTQGGEDGGFAVDEAGLLRETGWAGADVEIGDKNDSHVEQRNDRRVEPPRHKGTKAQRAHREGQSWG